jgi:hypothetical protein
MNFPDHGIAIAATMVAAVIASGCGGEARAVTTASLGTQYLIGVDISGSRAEPDLRDARALLQDLVARQMTYGDELVLIEMYGATDPRQYRDSIPAMNGSAPSPREKRELDDFRARAMAVLPMFFDSTRKAQIRATDVFGTLFRAADYARAPGHDRSVLVLLSDMIQATGEANMAGEAGIPGTSWIANRAEEGRLPELRGICVVVSGAETKSARGAKLRRFWMEYFSQAGASIDVDEYRGMLVDASQLRC